MYINVEKLQKMAKGKHIVVKTDVCKHEFGSTEGVMKYLREKFTTDFEKAMWPKATVKYYFEQNDDTGVIQAIRNKWIGKKNFKDVVADILIVEAGVYEAR